MLELLLKRCRLTSLSLNGLTALILLGGTAPAHAQQAYSSSLHDFLVRETAAEHPDDVARILEHWLARTDAAAPPPADRARVLADYVTLQSRAGHDRDALNAARAAGFHTLPAYTLDPLFLAARREALLDDERELLIALRRHDAAAPLTRLRSAQYAFDQGTPDVARELARGLLADTTAPAGVRAAAAELVGAVEEQAEHFHEAAQAYARALELEPGSRSARRADIYLIARQGAAAAALDEARRANAAAEQAGQPALFTPVEIFGLRQQAVGQDIVWGIEQRDIVGGARRFDALDQALARSAALLEEIGTPVDPALQSVRNRTRFDRLVALSARGDAQACVDLYEALVAEGVRVPYYGLAPAADAYARLRRSDLAVPLYELAVSEAGSRLPMPSDTHFGLFYAYIDTARFRQAEALLSQMEAATPPTVRLAPLPDTPNPDYTEVRDLRGRYFLYTDQPARAEQTYQALTREAPFNAAFADGLARTEAAREHPHTALTLARTSAVDHPDSVPLRETVAQGLSATGQHRAAREAVEQLQVDYPESGPVQNTAREAKAQRSPTLTVDSTYGKGNNNSALSDEDFLIDARLQSGLMDDQWRVFTRQAWAYGNTENGRAHRGRTGLGLRWERDGFTLEGEAHRDTGGPRSGGFAAAGTYRWGDHVELGLAYDSNALDVPWRAYDAGIAANLVQASAAYIVDESRRFDLRYQRMDYTDGNQNHAGSLAWTERWYSGPSQQFQTTLRTDASRNRRNDVPYYSPDSDGSVELEARYQLLTWKRDHRTLVQRLYANAGTYRQSGYGAEAMYGLRYEHEWTFRPGWSVTYGIGTAWHPYDGQRERRTIGYLNLAIPFL
ncbi:poly-beta-1,6 N-acetyl-D-glucosamine export porin PgaA [Pseudomonadota bacterium AL_CKDN230030165-1A_HGKHYDSX7]